jgi:hypothetical protein
MAIHMCMMNPDLKGMFVRHHEFGVGLAFGEGSSNGQLCEEAMEPLLRNVRGGKGSHGGVDRWVG